MNLINKGYYAYQKYQTRQQLRLLSSEQMEDIGKSSQQVSDEVLKSSLTYLVNELLKGRFEMKVNQLLRRC